MITSEVGITLSALFMVVGGIIGILGFMSKREAEKYQVGHDAGIIVTKLDSLILSNGQLLEKINTIEQGVNDHEVRITVLENKRARTKSVE